MKKGFTLIELLGVIIILGIIATIAVPLVQRTIVESNQTAYLQQVASFEKAAKNYVASDIYNMTSCETKNCEVSLSQLQKGGFLPSGDIKNPKTDSNFDMENVVIISYSGGKFSYKYDTDQDPN